MAMDQEVYALEDLAIIHHTIYGEHGCFGTDNSIWWQVALSRVTEVFKHLRAFRPVFLLAHYLKLTSKNLNKLSYMSEINAVSHKTRLSQAFI